jgi:cytosine/adenosine deaminase-related metal-dependent hydrolase
LKLRDILGIESGTKADFIASDARARMPERHILRLSVTALDHRGMRARIS